MKWKIVIWALTLCRPSRGGTCVFLKVCVFVSWGFSKAPHSPNMFLSVHFTKTEEVVHNLTQPAVSLLPLSTGHRLQIWPIRLCSTNCSHDYAFDLHLLTVWFVHIKLHQKLLKQRQRQSSQDQCFGQGWTELGLFFFLNLGEASLLLIQSLKCNFGKTWFQNIGRI